MELIVIKSEEFKQDLKRFIESVIVNHVKSKPDDPGELLTREETAAFLKVGTGTVDRWARYGRLRKYSIHNKVYFKKHEILEELILLNDE